MSFLRYQQQPGLFVREVLGQNLWWAQERVLELLVTEEEVTVRACHSVGKTFVASCAVLWWLFCHEPAVVVTTAPSHRQVKDVLWRSIRRLHRTATLPLPGEVRETQIKITEETFATGFSTDETDRFQGFHSPHLLILVEEASGVPETIFEGITGCLAAAGNRLLMIGNPLRPSGRFYQSHQTGTAAKVQLSAFDSPNIDGVTLPVAAGRALTTDTLLWPDPVRRELVTPKWVNDRREEWGEESPLYISRVLGDFPDASDDTLLPLSWVEAAVERGRSAGCQWRFWTGTGYPVEGDVTGTAAASQSDDPLETGDRTRPQWECLAGRVVGVDVARYGSCETVAVVREEDVVQELIAWRGADLMTTAARVRAIARAARARIRVDEVGVGGGVIDRLKEWAVPAIGINVGLAPRDRERFVCRRDELFWALRDRFRAGSIAIPDDGRLLRQLTALRFSYSTRGQIRIEGKEELRDRGEPSPDRADALALAYADTTALTPLAEAGPARQVLCAWGRR